MSEPFVAVARPSRLSFICEGRRRKIFKPRNGTHYFVRFEYKHKSHRRSLETSNEQVAIERAKAMITAAFQGDAATMQSTKLHAPYAMLPAIEARYVAHYGTTQDRRRTARGNIAALRKMVEAAGMRFETANALALDDALVRRFEAEELKRVETDAAGHMLPASELRVRTSVESIVTQARAVFRKSRLSWYEGLTLPDLTKFREQGFTRPQRPKPKRLDDGVIEAIQRDAPRLARENPPLYATFLLFSQCGLRNREIKHARARWLHRRPDGSGVIDITNRPEENFIPKKGTEGTVPVAGAVLEALLRIAEADPEGFLVPATSPTARAKVVDREHSEWVSQWIKDRTKTSYELRRFAGSFYFKQCGGKITKVQKFLRHRDLSTTLNWYWYDLDELEPLAAPAWMEPQLRVVA